MTILNDAEKEVHNPVQNAAEPSSTEPHKTPEPIAVSPCDCESNLEFAGACESMQNAGNWAIQDSNLWPPACKAGALTN
jgi:hypothetical protein